MWLRTTALRVRQRSTHLPRCLPSLYSHPLASYSVTTHAEAIRTKSLQQAASTLETGEEDHSMNYQLVIVGTGWAGYHMFTQCKKYRKDIEHMMGKPVDLVVISKRNHFLYTPLLASTTVGTLEFRSIIEPIRDNVFRHENDFHYANVLSIDPHLKQVFVESEISKRLYGIPYDTLVVACGAQPLTFGLPGVQEYALFLKEIAHARQIRNRILENFEMATQRGTTSQEKKQLLHFVVVGGGPTGVEFCAELYDFLQQDLVELYPQTSKYLCVTLLDSGDILTGFDLALREFAMKRITARPNMKIVKKNCIEVTKDSVTLNDGEKIPCGMVVWTAGVGPNELTKSLTMFTKSKRGNLLTNEYCQIMGAPEVEPVGPCGMPLRSNVFAIGDCGEIDKYPLPPTAQKAESQADYLLYILRGKNHTKPPAPYIFHNKGMMAYLGSFEGLFELKNPRNDKSAWAKLHGWRAWFLWRSAYLTKLGSWRLRLQVPLDWLKALVVGRDISRF